MEEEADYGKSWNGVFLRMSYGRVGNFPGDRWGGGNRADKGSVEKESFTKVEYGRGESGCCACLWIFCCFVDE